MIAFTRRSRLASFRRKSSGPSLRLRLLRWLWSTHPRRIRHDSITLVDTNLDDTDDQAFFQTAVAALTRIEQLDPRRYGRVKGQIEILVNAESNALAQQFGTIRSCQVDFGRFDRRPDKLQFTIGRLATVLVHESTHGYLHCRGFQYSDDLWSRIERLCVTEERRFAGKYAAVYGGMLDELAPAFAAERWHFFRTASRYQHLRAYIRRLSESKKRSTSGAV